MSGWITDVPGIRVGHWTDPIGATGCTVVLCEPPAVAAVDVRGGSPGTRETDLLRPGALVERVDGVLLTGGSAFGLAAATGVMRYLEERGRGHPAAAGPVPIVPAAVIYDLAIGDPKARPGEAEGYAAASQAAAGPVAEGSVGAGTGAVVARHLGAAGAVRGGLGTASRRASTGSIVGAIVVVNSFGRVFDPTDGRPLAPNLEGQPDLAGEFGSTVIGVIATDARLDRLALTRLAGQGHNGVARCIRPVHTRYDGDALFALSTERLDSPALEELGELAADAVIEAVLRAVRNATPFAGIPIVGT